MFAIDAVRLAVWPRRRRVTKRIPTQTAPMNRANPIPIGLMPRVPSRLISGMELMQCMEACYGGQFDRMRRPKSLMPRAFVLASFLIVHGIRAALREGPRHR